MNGIKAMGRRSSRADAAEGSDRRLAQQNPQAGEGARRTWSQQAAIAGRKPRAQLVDVIRPVAARDEGERTAAPVESRSGNR